MRLERLPEPGLAAASSDSHTASATLQPAPLDNATPQTIPEEEDMGAGGGKLRKTGLHTSRGEMPPLAPAVATEAASKELESEVDGLLSSLMQWREAHRLVLMVANTRHNSTTRRNLLEDPIGFGQAVQETPAPDVLCLQEVLDGSSYVADGYQCVVTSRAKSRSLKEMSYGLVDADEAAPDRMLVNEIHLRSETSDWEVVTSGVEQLSSPDLQVWPLGLATSQPVAARTATWVKLRCQGQPRGPYAFIINAQLTGGLFEDALFVKQVTEERRLQMERIMRLFESRAEIGDIGVIVGDAGLGDPRDVGELIREYFWQKVSPSEQVRTDSVEATLDSEELWSRFKSYILAPSEVLRNRGWTVAYGQDAGVPGHRGHTANFIAVSRPVRAVGHELPSEGDVLLPVQPSVAVAAEGNDAPAKGIAVATKASIAVSFPAVEGADGHFLGLDEGPPAWWSRSDVELQDELRELLKERHAQEELAEDMQFRLTSELNRLRKDCDGHGQSIAQLLKCLTEAKSAITESIKETSSKRSVLSSEIEREKAQRAMLDAALQDETSEAEGRLRLAEQQLNTALAGRSSLEAQVRTALQVRKELENHIEAERLGRSELEAAGRRELARWSERNQPFSNNGDAESEAAQSQRDTARHMEEELELASKVESARAARSELRAQLEVETAAWNYEVHIIRQELQKRDEECRAEEEVVQALREEQENSSSEHLELQSQLTDAQSSLSEVDSRLEIVLPQIQSLEAQLHDRNAPTRPSALGGGVGDLHGDPDLREQLHKKQLELEKEAEIHRSLQEELHSRQGLNGLLSCIKRPREPKRSHTGSASSSSSRPATPSFQPPPTVTPAITAPEPASPAASPSPAMPAKPPVFTGGSDLGSQLPRGSDLGSDAPRGGASDLGSQAGRGSQVTPRGSEPGVSQLLAARVAAGGSEGGSQAPSRTPSQGIMAQEHSQGASQPPSQPISRMPSPSPFPSQRRESRASGGSDARPKEITASQQSVQSSVRKPPSSWDGAGLGLASDPGSEDGRSREWM
mmetsp:Transcript_52609/g.125661  ORF Transcript_52609/g.125661 Transcript_52609/m.125661 type:complete len:1033 (+) Transcript_52609:113-3211(+)|eukprot:CAMPEP_0178385120 /NCGR_PEP_ID=MMETSP0689_2-20121128/7871_1 /TAXON_ID=160604 /ORGANISM="Amphidinium massartii, Strain CS-259" /LENGTH=1032 /DNA_ID=CAMNT_0020005397 /DNA_START=54 /DNA_END=3152 /DNA_ORIENTATION=+